MAIATIAVLSVVCLWLAARVYFLRRFFVEYNRSEQILMLWPKVEVTSVSFDLSGTTARLYRGSQVMAKMPYDLVMGERRKLAWALSASGGIASLLTGFFTRLRRKPGSASSAKNS